MARHFNALRDRPLDYVCDPRLADVARRAARMADLRGYQNAEYSQICAAIGCGAYAVADRLLARAGFGE